MFYLKNGNMKKNIGKTDSAIRLIMVALLVILYFLLGLTGTLGFVVLAIAIILCLTVIFGICPLYLPFGINTTGKKEKK